MQQLMNGVFVVVQINGKQIFNSGLPIPNDYDAGKLLIANLGGDAMATVAAYHAQGEINRLKEELEKAKKKPELFVEEAVQSHVR